MRAGLTCKGWKVGLQQVQIDLALMQLCSRLDAAYPLRAAWRSSSTPPVNQWGFRASPSLYGIYLPTL